MIKLSSDYGDAACAKKFNASLHFTPWDKYGDINSRRRPNVRTKSVRGRLHTLCKKASIILIKYPFNEEP